MPCWKCGDWIKDPQYRIYYGRKLPRHYYAEEGPLATIVWVAECLPSCHAMKALARLEASWRQYKRIHEALREGPRGGTTARCLRLLEESDRTHWQLRFHVRGLMKELEAEKERCYFSVMERFRVPPAPESLPAEFIPPPPRRPVDSEGGAERPPHSCWV